MKKSYGVFLLSFIASILIYVSIHDFNFLYTAFVLALFSSTLFLFYVSKKAYFYISFFIVAVLIFSGLIPFLWAVEILAVSLIMQSILIRGLSFRAKKLNRNLEVRRDIAHIILGSIFLFIIYEHFISFSVFLILIGILSAYFAFVYSDKANIIRGMFERNGVIFGSGALFMGAGALLLIGFVHGFDILFVGLFAVLVSDPIATIIGIKMKNNVGNKSLYGSTAFFLSLLVPSVIFLGWVGIIFSAVVMLAERFSPVDDNIFIPIIATLSLLFYSLI